MTLSQTPMQVVRHIEEAFPGQLEHQFGKILLMPDNVVRLSGILGLLEQIPNEFIILSEADFTTFIAAREGLRGEIAGVRAAPQMRRQNLSRSFGDLSSLGAIHSLLSQCPDTGAQTKSTDLDFVKDIEFREDLIRDRDSCNRFTSLGEWKGATIMGGSVIESLLLWRLQQAPASDVKAAKAKLAKNPGNNLERWDLEPLLEVAELLRYIEPETVKVCGVAREFRDLIHPGRSQRLGKKCDQATALSVTAAIALVIRDFA